MRHLFLSVVALLAVLAFSNIGTSSAEAGKRHHKRALKNHHMKAPGHRRHRARHHVRHRKYARKQRYVLHQRRSARSGYSSRYRVYHAPRRARGHKRYKRQYDVNSHHRSYRRHNRVHQHHHAGGKYRNRTQFCRRNWERHHGHKVVVRRCVWVHNSKLHRYESH